MFSIVYHIVFLLFSLYILLTTCSYGIYEFINEKNKIGGIIVIIFTIFCVLFSNILVWQH